MSTETLSKKFSTFIKNIPKTNTLAYLYNELGKRGVRVVYDKADNFNKNEPEFKRIILGTFVRSCSFEFPGTIISQNPDGIYQAISVPSPPPHTKYTMKHLASSAEQKFVKDGKQLFTAKKAQDGTTVSLYYFEGQWCVSTYRGFDVTNSYATKEKTYKQLLDEVFNNYPKFSYESLNTSCSYTIGFSHSDFHPFLSTVNPTQQPSTSAWFIQSSNLENFNNGKSFINYDENIGLPFQDTVTKSLSELINTSKNAYNTFVKTKEVNYGYLIRVGYRQYLIESTLLENIRTLFYSNKFNKLDPSFDKRKYIIVYSFLSAEKYTVFLNLFPQYTDEFKSLRKKIDNVIELMVKISNIKNYVPHSLYETIVNEYYHTVGKTITLSKMNPDDVRGILYSIIYDTKNTNFVYQLSYSSNI